MPDLSTWPKDWEDKPSTNTPITALELERIEAGVIAGIRPPLTAITANATLARSHEGEVLAVNAAAAVTITVPPSSLVAFPIGTTIQVAQIGVGLVTVAAAAGVTLDGTGTGRTTLRQFGVLTLVKRAVENWLVIPPTRPVEVITETAYQALGTKDPATVYLRY